MGLRRTSSIRYRTLCLHILSGTRIRATVVRLTHAKQHKTYKQARVANMEPDNHWMELRRHPNQNTLKRANVEPDSQSLGLRRHPNPSIHNQITSKRTQKRKRLPGVVSHDHLPTYLVWNEDQGDVVPLKGKGILARNQGETHYQGAVLEPSVIMHHCPMLWFLPTCTTAS